MRVLRLLIYEGTAERIAKVLTQSLPDGKKNFGPDLSIKAITLNDKDTDAVLEIELNHDEG